MGRKGKRIELNVKEMKDRVTELKKNITKLETDKRELSVLQNFLKELETYELFKSGKSQMNFPKRPVYSGLADDDFPE